MSSIKSAAPAMPLDIDAAPALPRVTPPGAGARFQSVLSAGAQAIWSGVETASPLLPAAAAVSAAVGSAQGASPLQAASIVSTTGSGGATSLSELAGDSMAYLKLQQNIQKENQHFTALSNVLKARHDTAKSTINNIR